ncbi:uncharacterized protein [Dysidea avara]|uniref:uncharacterized protein n=1 Tax=Dysidea avara TaxID=196820 RepID=UPI0033249932
MPVIRGIRRDREHYLTSPETTPINDCDTCITCDRPIVNDYLECVWCERHQHRSCARISVDLCDLPKNIVFFCCECINKLPTALITYEKTKEACTTIENKLKSVQDTLSNRFDSLAETINDLSYQLNCHDVEDLDNVSTVSSQPPKQELSTRLSSKHPLSVKSIASMTADIILEEKEKEKRRQNLIVHNVPESNLTEAHARKKEDIQNLTTLFNQYIGVSASITNAIRIGKQGNKPRLIKVSLSSREETLTILRSRWNLRSKEHPSHVTKTFITPDLTPLEQQKSKQLRAELANLNKEGKRYRIKHGKIILREAATFQSNK